MSIPPLQTILCVDDEEDIRAVLEIALGDVGGFGVRLCGSGAEAVVAARETGPDLAILDVMMPGMDGLSTLRAFREDPRIAGLPVIFLTARVSADEQDAYLRAGAAAVIAKPFDPERLVDEVREVWRRVHTVAG